MVKVLTGVQPGQVSEAEAEVIANAPVQQIQERVPQASEAASLSEFLTTTPQASVEDVSAGIEAAANVELQREREAVPDIITRRDSPEVVEWNRNLDAAAVSASVDPKGDGGLAERSVIMADRFSTGDLGLGGLTAAADNEVKSTLAASNAIDPNGNFDRGFLQMTSVITENFFAGAQYSEGIEGAAVEGEAEGAAVTKAQGNKQLGDQIHREYQRYRNAQEGRPTDDYADLSPEQATLLGDIAKEMYYEANNLPEGEKIVARGRAPDGQVTFTVTKHGSDRMAAGNAARKRLFPKQHVRPSKTPLPGGKLVGEGRKYTRDVSGRTGAVAGARVIHEAMRNLNQVANVVDKQRLKVLLLTAMPVLREQVDPSHPLAAINHVGQNKIEAFRAKGLDEEAVASEYAKLVDDLAQSIFGIATERNGANHLTYYLQSFNGRIAPQQTLLDPTTSKSVRFVTRNAVPAKATAGSRIEKNLRQMYAMMLVPGADAKLPEGREAALEQATPQLVRWGRELQAALNAVSDSQIEATAQAIADGVPLSDPNFPQLPDVTANISPELVAAITKKGEDGQAFIDGLMDFALYHENKQKGRPHHSYFNAYMDGKTNGLASNGIQMGSEQVAYKTGVLRSQGETLLDDDVDIRDDLKNTLLRMVEGGFDGHIGPEMTGPLHNVATKLYGVRDLNKATTMTFGYGKELDSFKSDIDEYLGILEQSDPDVAQAVSSLVEGMGSRQMLIDTLHGKYIEGLANALDENALKSRALMRSAAYLFALSNEVFSINSATGYELVMGGTEITGWQDGVEYKVWTGKGYEKRQAGVYGREVTSAAVKRRADADAGTVEGEVGGFAYGGAVPAPVQSLDAATVALTASGKSWDKLKAASHGAPYLHTIYDAFKVDAMGYDVVLDEVNKNWLDAGMNWSYLEETQKAIGELRKTFQDKYGDRANNSPLTAAEAAQMMWFLELSPSQGGKLYPANLFNKMSKLIEIPRGATSEQAREMGVESSKRIVAAMKAAGFNVYSPPNEITVGHLKAFMRAFSDELQLAPRLGRMVNETNNKKKKLKAKIKADGTKVYQYYAH